MRRRIIRTRELSALGFLLMMFLGVGAINPGFLKPSNIFLLFDSSVVYTVTALGMAVILMTGEIDFSVGATLGMAAAVSGAMIRVGQPWALGILAALAVGLVIGFVNGFGVTVLRIPSVIMTFGMQGIVRGLLNIYTKGRWIENIDPDFKALSQARLMGTLTYAYLGVILLMVVMQLLLARTHLGRNVPAIGDNLSGALLLGLPVKRTKWAAFAIAGLLAGLGGVIYASRFGTVTPLSGKGYAMTVIVACVLGGISVSGGAGSLFGAAIGAVIISSIPRLMIYIGLSSSFSDVITGLLLVFIVLSDSLIKKRASEHARKQRLTSRSALCKEV